MILMQDTEEGMGSKGNAITITTDNEKIQMKDRTGSMQGPTKSTMENILGESARSIAEVTITKVTIRGTTITTITTGEIRGVKNIQMQATATRGLYQVPIHALSMKAET